MPKFATKLGSGEPLQSGEATAAAPDPEPPVQEPVVYTNETPSGLVVEYEPTPRRLYRVNSQEVPSVTTILDVLHKPALPWWGMKVGVEGVLKLFDHGTVFAQQKDGWNQPSSILIDQASGELDAEDIVRFLTQEKLTVNHVVKEASDRGLSVHDAFETWARTGQKPFALEYPEAERGYIDGLNAFLNDLQVATPVRAEVMVGSAEHGFAGRYDLDLAIHESHDLVVKAYPKRENKVETFPHGSYLVDLKTSKSVYASHHLQLAAYELASQESGFEPTDFQAIIHVTSDGQYEFVLGKANPEQFLAVKEVWEVLQGLK